MSGKLGTMKLTMHDFLRSVDEHGTAGCTALIDVGHLPSIVYGQAGKAADKDYWDASQGCLTGAGRAALAGMFEGWAKGQRYGQADG